MGLRDQRAQHLGVLREIPAMVAGELPLAVGHKSHLVHRQFARHQVTHAVHQVVQWVAFDIEFPSGPVLHECGQLQHVAGADVALIGPGVYGDAVSTRLQAQLRGARHAGNA